MIGTPNIQCRPTPLLWEGQQGILDEGGRVLLDSRYRGLREDRGPAPGPDPVPLPPPFAYYNADADLSSVAADSISGNDLSGTAHVISNANGLIGPCAEWIPWGFSAELQRDVFLDVPHTLPGFPGWTPNSDFTVRFWLYLTAMSFSELSLFTFIRSLDDSQEELIVGLKQNDGGFNTWVPVGQAACIVRFGSNFNDGVDLFTGDHVTNHFPFNEWTRFVVLWKESTRKLIVYLNDAIIINVTVSSSFFKGSSTPGLRWGHFAAQNFSGRMDELGLWNFVWSATVLNRDWNDGDGRTYP